jgi:hypothetical protein
MHLNGATLFDYGRSTRRQLLLALGIAVTVEETSEALDG